MFTRWRPVPSARTVRILYQLGYICSGTACGLATLCLEEQRRRIQMLQKVADNAKVIRQHPKYRGNHALALATSDDSTPWSMDSRWTPERGNTDPPTSLEESVRVNDGAIEGPLLPSVVEREHANSHRRWRGNQSDYGNSRSDRSRHLRSDSRRFPRLAGSRQQPSPSLPHFNATRAKDRKTGLMAPPQAFDEGQDVSRKDINSTISDAPEGNTHQRSASSTITHTRIEDNSTGMHNVSPNAASSPSISRDVSRSVLSSPQSEANDGDIPYLNTLRSGTLYQVSAICKWKLSNNCFTEADERALCDIIPKRIDEFPLRRLWNFFRNLVRSTAFAETEHRQRTRLVFLFFVSASAIDEHGTKTNLLRASILKEGLGAVKDDVIVEELEQVCKTCLSKNEASTAARLFLDFGYGRSHNLAPDRLASEIMEVAIANSDMTSYGVLLRWKARRKRIELDVLAPQIDHFIQACTPAGDQESLINATVCYNDPFGVFEDEKRLDLLGEESRIKLCITLSTDPALQTQFDSCFRSLPKEARSSVAETSSISALRTTWKTTHNADAIDAQLSSLNTRFEDLLDENALLKLNETAVEIYVQGGRVDRALTTIKRMHGRNEVTSVVMCQTVLMFAKQKKWNLVDKLLDLAKKSISFRIDGDARRAFNEVVRIYCRSHDGDDILQFVKSAVEDLAFIPNRATLEIVLGRLVSLRRLDLLPQWYQLLDTLELGAVIDAKLAVTLLRRYYIACRPSHVFMTWLCRKLLVHLPGFASPSLVQLVGQAIAYDLRHLAGQYARQQRRHAYQRLRRLEGSMGFIPSPGFVWNHHLYFHDSTRDSAVQLETGSETSTTPSSPEKQLEGHMWLHISKGEHRKAVDLYEENLDAAEVPPSPQVLELAVQASLSACDGDRSEADALLSKAQHAGMNITCASGPLIVNELKRLQANDQINIIRLRKAVMAYYQANDENGWQPRHYPALKLADALIARKYVNEALGFLSTIHASKWAEERPLDIGAMTLFLRGYVAVQSLAGIRWVIYTILDQDIRITKQFMKQLRFLIRGNYKWMDKLSSEAHPLLSSWVSLCQERRKKQITDTCNFGWNLVRTIVQCSALDSKVDIKADNYLEDGVASEARREADNNDFVDESYYSDEHSDTSDGQIESDTQQPMAADWEAEKAFRLRLKGRALARGTSDKSSTLTSTPPSDEDEDEQIATIREEVGLTVPRAQPSAEDESSIFRPFV